MTMFSSYSVVVMMLFIVGASMVTSRTVKTDALSPSSSHDQFSPLASSPELSPLEQSYTDFLEACATTLSEKCGQEFYSFLFEKGTSYSDDCCRKLVSIGKVCHFGMVMYSVGQSQFKDNASVILRQSGEVWDKCASVA